MPSFKIPYSRQSVDQFDIEQVEKILESDWLTQGPKVEQFEREIAAYCQVKYAVAVANGTAALHLAALAADLAPGDEAITTPISFLATANCVFYAGAKPIFADIDYQTVNIDPEKIRKAMTKKTKALIPVDFAGLPADLAEIKSIANKHGLVIIEDASHALGADYLGSKVGSCRFSDMTVFSFHAVKTITTGEGGCITTNNKRYYQKLLMLRNHGIYQSDSLKKKFGGWYRQMKFLGYNYRMTDIQSALGLSQLKNLGAFIQRRRDIAEKYQAAFSDLQDLVMLPSPTFADRSHAWHLYVLRLRLDKTFLNRKQLYEMLHNAGILAQVHYIPIYHHPYYQRTLKIKQKYPLAEKYYQEALSLPIFPNLKGDEFDHIVKTIKKIFNSAKSKK